MVATTPSTFHNPLSLVMLTAAATTRRRSVGAAPRRGWAHPSSSRHVEMLRCVGETTLRSADSTVKTRDATIDVGERKLFLLRTGNVSVVPATAVPQTANRISPHDVLEFSPAEVMPASAYQLRR